MRHSLKYLLLSFSILPLFSFAQKFPKVQTTSVRAPQNIKIDGKLTEWNEKLQAYNPANKVFYTMANDDTNLYVILRADEWFSIRKIITGGITTTITTLSQADNKTRPQRIDAAITYPMLGNTKKSEDLSFEIPTDNGVLSTGKADSVSAAVNKTIAQLFKLIGVNGVKSITESTISIYNSYGIEVSAKINNDMRFVYELAIPLKYLNITPNMAGKFKYSIKLNGEPQVASNGIGKVQFSNPAAVLPPESMYMAYPTYFSGEYELAK